MKLISIVYFFALSSVVYASEDISLVSAEHQSYDSVACIGSLQKFLGEHWKLVDFIETKREDDNPRITLKFKPKNASSEEKFTALFDFDYLSDCPIVKIFYLNMEVVFDTVLNERKRLGFDIVKHKIIQITDNSIFFEFTQALQGEFKHVWGKLVTSNQSLKWYYLYVTNLNEVEHIRPYWENKFSELL